MRNLLSSALTVICATALACQVASAQDVTREKLARAAELQDQGRSSEAAAVLTSVLQEPSTLTRDEQGVAQNLQGSAMQSLHGLDEARRAYNPAIALLHDSTTAKAQYAAALDNLGSLEAASQHDRESVSLRIRAKQLYMALQDHGGVARSANNLAVLALERHDCREAEREIAQVFKADPLASGLTADDRGSFLSVRGSTAAQCAQNNDGADDEQQAILLWSQAYGPTFPKLCGAYTRLAEAQAKAGRTTEALNSVRRALAIESQAGGITDALAHSQTMLSYGRILAMRGQTKKEGLEIMNNIKERKRKKPPLKFKSSPIIPKSIGKALFIH